MTRQGIIKLAKVQKKAAFWEQIQKLSGATLIALTAAVTGTGFLGGMLLGKYTAPRKTDIQNVTKQYQVARLKSDIQKQKALLARQQRIYSDKQKPKKSVYGIV